MGLIDAPKGKWGADQWGNKTIIVEEGFTYPFIDTVAPHIMPNPALGPEELYDYLYTGRVGGFIYETPASRLQAHFLEVLYRMRTKAARKIRG